MVSKEQKRAAALHEKLQILRSITNSQALNDTSIIIDATKYIEDLKLKVEKLNEDIANGRGSSSGQNSLPVVISGASAISSKVKVETTEKGCRIHVFSHKSCPGLLECLLRVFDNLGLTVIEATGSCTESFQLEAVGENEEEGQTIIDVKRVKQAILQAIKDCT